jgi:hypothetical protein
MSRSSNRRWRVRLLIGGLVCLVAFVVWVTAEIARSGLNSGSQVAGVVSMYVTIATLLVAIPAAVASARTPETGDTPVTADMLDAAAEALAMAVRGELETEERIRRIHDPFPLPVRFSQQLSHESLVLE